MNITYQHLHDYLINNQNTYTKKDGSSEVWTSKFEHYNIILRRNFETKKKSINTFQEKFYKYSFEFRDRRNSNLVYFRLNNLNEHLDSKKMLKDLEGYGMNDLPSIMKVIFIQIEATILNTELPKKIDSNKMKSIKV